MIHIPKEILWDYREPPEDLLWRLQRPADFFPRYGQDRATVALLYRHRDQLKLDPPTWALIKAYPEAWEEK
ncbi:MAG: hypothetical protein HY892_05495 [Deltaproteobacteria bacterium]|nr:hypothetical protein [Deltaproteobacteria bacterium]